MKSFKLASVSLGHVLILLSFVHFLVFCHYKCYWSILYFAFPNPRDLVSLYWQSRSGLWVCLLSRVYEMGIDATIFITSTFARNPSLHRWGLKIFSYFGNYIRCICLIGLPYKINIDRVVKATEMCFLIMQEA